VSAEEILGQALGGIAMAVVAYALVEAVMRRTRWM